MGIYPIRRPILTLPLAAMHPHVGSGTRHEFLIRDENRGRYPTRHARSPKEGASMRPTGQGGVPPNHRQGRVPQTKHTFGASGCLMERPKPGPPKT